MSSNALLLSLCLLFPACASSAPDDYSPDDGDGGTRAVPLVEAVPDGWPVGQVEAFAESRRELYASLEARSPEERARYRDLMDLGEGSLERAVAAETEARLQAFVREQEDAGWFLVSRDEKRLYFRRP